MDKKEIIISEGKRPLWQSIIAAVLYAIIVISIVLFVLNIKVMYREVGSVFLLIPLFAMALRFSVIQTLYLDLNKREYKRELSVGFVKTGQWKYLPKVEYISVFSQNVIKDHDGDDIGPRAIRYDVNIWYEISKHFTIYSNYEKEAALEMGRYLAIKLKTRLLDATLHEDHVWIDLPEEVSQQAVSND